MFGTFFSENRDDFECVISIAVKRLRIVNEVYSKKADKIIFSEFPRCEIDGYNRAVHDPEKLRNFDSFDFGYINRIENANKDLISRGCVGVY